MAFIVNSLLLILGAALFFGTSSSVGRFVDLFNALSNSQIVGAIASPMLSMLFAVALLASGQSSTITGTLHSFENAALGPTTFDSAHVRDPSAHLRDLLPWQRSQNRKPVDLLAGLPQYRITIRRHPASALH